jgi:hypothetical protein
MICHFPLPRPSPPVGAHDLPFSAAETIAPGRCDHAGAEAAGPTRVEVIDEERLRVGVADAVEVVPVGIAGSNRVLGEQRQIAAQRNHRLLGQVDSVIQTQI